MRHKVCDFAVDPLMPLEARQAGKGLRHDGQGKVPATGGRPGVTHVGGAVVANLED